MSEWHGKGTPHFNWRSKGYGERSQVDVGRRNWDTVSISVSLGDVFVGHELTPDLARELSAVLLDAAEQVEANPRSLKVEGTDHV